MTDAVLYDQDGHVVTVTMNKPESRNPLTDGDLVEAFIKACHRAREDPDVRVVIVTGAGPAFSAGGNLKHMRDKSGTFAGSPSQIRDSYRSGIQKLALTLYNLEIPTIAAVNGPSYGAGCDLTIACDMRIASETATFAENFVKVGLISGDGGSWLLPRAVGLSRAAQMTFTGEPVDAQTALAWGLVSKVVAPDDLLPAAKDLAARIAVNAPGALRMAKRLLREGQTTRFDSLLELAAAFQGACHHSRDHDEAVNAFFEKRKPEFTGS